MSPEVYQPFIDQGILGCLIVVLFYFLWKASKEHREDRKEWVAKMEGQNDKMIDAFNDNTSVLSELKTIIKSGRK